MWANFRETYPSRPFCLLVTGPEAKIRIPDDFRSDSLARYTDQVVRDNGNASIADDWLTLCGLENYTSVNVDWVGVFIDDSGSMREAQVAASRDLFYGALKALGIQVRNVVNGQENWILPFMTTLASESNLG